MVKVWGCVCVCFVYSLLMVNRVNALWTDSMGLNVILEEMARFSFRTLIFRCLSHFLIRSIYARRCYSSTFCNFIPLSSGYILRIHHPRKPIFCQSNQNLIPFPSSCTHVLCCLVEQNHQVDALVKKN